MVKQKVFELIYEGKDDWGRKMYFILGTKKLIKKVDGEFYTTTLWGEPDVPFKKHIKFKVLGECPSVDTRSKNISKGISKLSKRIK